MYDPITGLDYCERCGAEIEGVCKRCGATQKEAKKWRRLRDNALMEEAIASAQLAGARVRKTKKAKEG